MHFSNKKEMTFTERAAVAISSLQRDAYAMGVLRAKLEARLKAGSDSVFPSSDLIRLVELVKVGEESLNDLAGRVESARFLEEFICIITSAATSLSGVRGDMEKVVPAAERALEEILTTIVNCSLVSECSDREREEVITQATDASAAQPTGVTYENDSCPLQKEEPQQLPA